jgi:predicted nucleotidyltransferase component of viral defense system
LNLKKIVANQQYNRRLYQLEDEQDKIKLELVYFPFPAMEKRKKIPEFSLTIDSLTDIMVNKILSTYQRNEVKDVFDLYIYFLLFCKKFSLPQLISLVEKKFGLTLELSILLTKINELCDQANSLVPLLTAPQKKLSHRMKFYFQEIFNSFANKKIK